MNKTQKIELLSKAFTNKKVEDARESIVIINEALSKEDQEKVRDNIVFAIHEEIGDGSFEIAYEVANSACDIMAEIYEDESIKDIDEAIYEQAGESANVYTAIRLSYLNIWNEEDISDYMKEYGETSISTACAIWYDKQVENACFIIKNWIMH